MAGERFRSALEQADDRIVAGRAMDGDVAAFAVLVRRYTPMMRAYTQRMLNASADVDDIVQETFVTAWQRFSELDDPSKVKSWLMRIVSRKAVDRIRALRPMLDVDDMEQSAPAHSAPARVVEARAGIEALGAALQELPAAQRECWVLREMGGYSYDEIAAELDISVSTARGLLARARKFMIVRMEAWR
ncbi:sigma-70 family RNA polymerase sigma factor [Microbacterium sp. ISL-103]|jgi:RNA polymerase sigma-70 factor (ECF subfamily)|uniref:RNA polymerase sigma factor n=1 Tax=Microbacterium sp. ISL-103 TaxID=2819156 RepID=UPI001BECA9DF|nr:sigma-70 family RNA polymerase sigma factor [Microbacterium sp. ISL-103]MBT2476384.1 sigma-70 family RNA polymerase sigma factor [Microbacterium sp. ISL-103]